MNKLLTILAFSIIALSYVQALPLTKSVLDDDMVRICLHNGSVYKIDKYLLGDILIKPKFKGSLILLDGEDCVVDDES